MNYDESRFKNILRKTDKDLLAIVAVDMRDDSYEILYTNGNYKDFLSGIVRRNFFDVWNREGLSLVYGEDCERLKQDFIRGKIGAGIKENGSYRISCRFVGKIGSPFFGNILVQPESPDSDTILITFSAAEKEHRSEEQIRELEDLLSQMEIRNYASRIHPHYLFNALASLRELILENPEQAYDLVYDLSVQLRSCLNAASSDRLISFSQELACIRSYLNIEKLRLGEKLKISFAIGTEDFLIVPLGIQALVENAVNHGIRKAGKGTLTLTTKKQEEDIRIEIADDGCGFDPALLEEKIAAGESVSTGLPSSLIRLKKQMNAKVVIESAPGKGTRIRIRIPEKRC